jgi:NDP-sugar pyrophosphorylase family protein
MKTNERFEEGWPINVVIMAGGKGTRLKSLTDSTHKSLIEVNGKPIILHLIDHLISFGFYNIYVSVGHLSDQITALLGDGSQLGISIKYIHETTPMGSMGSLTLKRDWDHDHFLILNGDIYTNFNVGKFISGYFERDADMAVSTLEHKVDIPWGVLTVDGNEEITHLHEKPTYSIVINTGIYLFNRQLLHLLPLAEPREGWEFIQSALNTKCKVVSIPLINGYWIDIGTTETLQKARDMHSHTKS